MANYRELQPPDYEQIATFSNLNNQRERGIWCKTPESWTDERERLFLENVSLKGEVFTQANDVGGRIVSFYAGFEYKRNAVFVVGVVDPTMPDYMDVWRKDAAEMFKKAVQRGNENVHIRLSDADNELVPWMEQEVGMARHDKQFVWTIDSTSIEAYIDKYVQ